MEGGTRASTKWIKSMDSVYITGLMAEFTKETGLMENNMGRENTYYRMELSRLGSGSMERGLIGSLREE